MTFPPAPPAAPARGTHPAPGATATSPRALPSPLAAAYRTVTEALGHLRITEVGDDLPAGDGWLRGGDLAADGPELEAYLALNARWTRDAYGRDPRPDVVAGFALHRYAWPATALLSLPHFLLRRIPHLGRDDVAMHPETGRVSVRAVPFSCLPDDPAAARPDAHVVGCEEELRATLRATLADHMAPLLDTFRPRMRRGTRAMWGLAADELAEGLWYVGGLLGEEERARTEADRLLPGHTAPFSGAAGFRDLCGPGGEQLPTRDRLSCCLYYTVRPADTCLTCPRTTDATRVSRLTGVEHSADSAS